MSAASHRIEVPMKNHHQETRLALLEQSTMHIYQALERIEKRFDEIERKFDHRLYELEKKIDHRFEKIDQCFDKFDNKIEKIDSKLYNELKYIGTRSWAQFGFLFAMITTILGVLAKVQGWF